MHHEEKPDSTYWYEFTHSEDRQKETPEHEPAGEMPNAQGQQEG